MIEYFRKKQLRLLQAVPEDFIRERYLKRIDCEERLIGVLGTRGVGKTTLMLQYLKRSWEKEESLYISADDIMLRDKGLFTMASEFSKLGGRVLVIDEVHLYPSWAQELKNIYDSFPSLIIRFCGSSMLSILHEQYDLSRRSVLVYMKELSFREYLILKEGIKLPELTLEDLKRDSIDISNNLVNKHQSILRNFQDYKSIGAYPFFTEGIQSFKEKLFNSLEKIIYKDIPSLKHIKFTNLSVFKRLIFRLIESGVPFKPNISSLASDFGVSVPAMYSFLEILSQTCIFRVVRKKSSKVSRKPEKILFNNTNILHAYANEYEIEVNPGTERETFFASCFKKVEYSDIGDFCVNEDIFEIGGKGKDFSQIKDASNGFIVPDTDTSVSKNKIPLWMFGLLR